MSKSNSTVNPVRKVRPQWGGRHRLIVVLLGTMATAIGFLLFYSNASEGRDESSGGIEAGIVWYGVLNDGLAEAKESGKPILLVSAAPNCAGVSGLW